MAGKTGVRKKLILGIFVDHKNINGRNSYVLNSDLLIHTRRNVLIYKCEHAWYISRRMKTLLVSAARGAARGRSGRTRRMLSHVSAVLIAAVRPCRKSRRPKAAQTHIETRTQQND